MTTLFTTIKTTLLTTLAASALLSITSTAQASVIHISTAYSTAVAPSTNDVTAQANYYKTTVLAAVAANPAGHGLYGTTIAQSTSSIQNQALFKNGNVSGSKGNIAWDINIDFNVASAEAAKPWVFRAGVDFGNGGAIFLDGVALTANKTDMWWNKSYNTASEVFNITSFYQQVIIL